MADIIFALVMIGLAIFGGGIYIGAGYAYRQMEKMFEDTPQGDVVRDSFGLHLEFSYTEPHSGVEVARVVSQWHEYVGV